MDLVGGRASIVGAVACGHIYVDGSSVGDITEASLKDRRILGEEGFISVFVVVDLHSGLVIAGPEVHARGFMDDAEILADVLPLVTRSLEESLAQGGKDAHALEQVVRRTVGRWVSATHRRRPMIVPVVLPV